MSDQPVCSPDHHTILPAGVVLAESAQFGDNQDQDCLSIYTSDEGEEDQVVHICDWPAFKAAGDQHQRERGGKI